MDGEKIKDQKRACEKNGSQLCNKNARACSPQEEGLAEKEKTESGNELNRRIDDGRK